MAIDNERNKAEFIYREAVYPGINIEVDLHGIMVTTKSKYQKICVIDTPFGKTLVTDGKTQSSLLDEYMYHESLVHPAMIKTYLNMNHEENKENTKKPKTVFIGGGGELATAREVLRHKSVEKIVMVDLDETVLEVCKKYLPEYGGEKVASNPRLEIIIGDAYEYLINCRDTFDVIIMDICDPIEAGPGIMLYTQEFYQHVKALLNEDGVFVTQAGTADSLYARTIEPGSDKDETCFVPISNTLKSVFDVVLPYSINIPSYGSDWGFLMAQSGEKVQTNFGVTDSTVIDELISKNITEIDDIESNNVDGSTNGGEILKYYDGESHRRMFALPKPIRYKFQKDKRIMTRENPVFMY